MKTWFLIFYFWNQQNWNHNAVGGPAIAFIETHTQQLCEALGSTSKKFIDSKMKDYAEPSNYRCVELEKAPQMGTDIKERQRIIKENEQYLNSLRQLLK